MVKFQSTADEIDWDGIMKTVRSITPKCGACGAILYHGHCEGCSISEIGEALIHDTPK